MESNKQIRHSAIDNEQADSSEVRGLGDGEIEPKGERTHVCGQQCGDCRGGEWRGF